MSIAENTPLIVAIDGPAGSGKSTIARLLAGKLGIPYLNTGAMYRALALSAMEHETLVEEQALVSRLASCGLDMRYDGRETRVFLGERDVTEAVRRDEVGVMASRVSVFPAVRAELVRRQQQLGQEWGGVVEGRDIGTVVFPDVQHKFFITASVEERAERRARELEQLGYEADREQIQRDVAERDQRDAEREASPLRIAPGAVVIDTSGKEPSVVLGLLLEYIDILNQARKS